jgi:hypothetical protein
MEFWYLIRGQAGESDSLDSNLPSLGLPLLDGES